MESRRIAALSPTLALCLKLVTELGTITATGWDGIHTTNEMTTEPSYHKARKSSGRSFRRLRKTLAAK